MSVGAFNEDLARWYNNGEITIQEYIRILGEREAERIALTDNYDFPKHIYIPGEGHETPDNAQRFYEYRQSDQTEANRESDSTESYHSGDEVDDITW